VWICRLKFQVFFLEATAVAGSLSCFPVNKRVFQKLDFLAWKQEKSVFLNIGGYQKGVKKHYVEARKKFSNKKCGLLLPQKQFFPRTNNKL